MMLVYHLGECSIPGIPRTASWVGCDEMVQPRYKAKLYSAVQELTIFKVVAAVIVLRCGIPDPTTYALSGGKRWN